jgi:hypothetical protein
MILQEELENGETNLRRVIISPNSIIHGFPSAHSVELDHFVIGSFVRRTIDSITQWFNGSMTQ